MLRGSVLLLAFVFSFPTIWSALVDRTITVDTAIVRFLIALPVAAVLLALVRSATRRRDHR